MFSKVTGQDKKEEATRPEAMSPPPVAAAPAPTPSAQPPVAAGSGAAAAPRNILSTDVEIKGTVKFDNDLVVDGKIDGEIKSDGSLTIGENAMIKAEIKTRSVVIYGKVHGNITVTDRVEIKANAELVGDVQAATIAIEAGAIFVGKSTVGTPKSMPAAGNKGAAPVPAKNSGGPNPSNQKPNAPAKAR